MALTLTPTAYHMSRALNWALFISMCVLGGHLGFRVTPLASAQTQAKVKAKAKPVEEESFPIVGAVSASVRWNHSVFQDNGASPASAEYDLGESQGFGWSVLNLSVSFSHMLKVSDAVSPIFLSGSIGFERTLSEGFNRAGVIPTATTQPQQFYVQDMNLSAGWNIPGVSSIIPKLNLNLGVNASVPFSLISQAQGVKTYLSSFLSFVYPTSFRLVVQGTSFVGYNVLDNPTRQIDCRVMPEACRISGADLGSPDDLMYWGGALNLQYPLIGGLRIGLTYRMFGSLGAAKFDEVDVDPYASPTAQSGEQVGALIHGTTLSLLFGFNRTASAAQQALNESLEDGEAGDEDSFLNRLSLTLSMTTNDRLYSSDGSRVTAPVFDFETANFSRTTYRFGALITL